MLIKKRDEDIPGFVREMRTKVIVRMFEKSKSVFKDWNEDTDQTALSCIEHDLEHWNANKFIKDEEELAATCDVFRKYAKEIKNTFI